MEESERSFRKFTLLNINSDKEKILKQEGVFVLTENNIYMFDVKNDVEQSVEIIPLNGADYVSLKFLYSIKRSKRNQNLVIFEYIKGEQLAYFIL